MYITQSIDQIVRAVNRSISFAYRQAMERLFEDELRSIRTNAVLPADTSPAGTVEWWLKYGSHLPLLHVFAKVAIVTSIATVEVEREFACQGKLLTGFQGC